MSITTRTLILHSVGLVLAASVLAQASPRVEVAEPTHDFGAVRKGERPSTTFVIENRGDGVLEIGEVRGSCSCTAVEFDQRIAPGKSGRVEVELDTSVLRGATASRLVVYTNDPSTPSVELTVKSEVRIAVVATPGYARFVVVEGETASAANVLWAAAGDELTVERVESPFPFLEVKFRRATAEERVESGTGAQWRIETRVAPSAPVGPFSGFLRVHVSHSDAELVTIPVSGLVEARVAVTPSAVDLGTVKRDRPPRHRVLIASRVETPIELHRVENPIAGLEATLSALEPGRRFALELIPQPEMRRGSFADELRIHTSLGAVTLPIRGAVE